ncbi:hypothetical protein ONZ45_g7505 [Pleurotus djamor]|nr:hypothetical protein ONZ45_g7505 [Pleurotus djamor]
MALQVHRQLRPLFSSFFSSACPRSSIHRLYSSSVSPLSTKKWGINGIPTPQSILADDDTPVDLSEDNDAANGANPDKVPLHKRRPPREPTPPEFQAHRRVLKESFPQGWQPPRKLSREAMEGLRQLHQFDKDQFTTAVLADKFKISPEAVRRILKSKWTPPKEKTAKLVTQERLYKEGMARAQREKEYAQAREVQSLKQGHGRPGRRGGLIGVHANDRLELQ